MAVVDENTVLLIQMNGDLSSGGHSINVHNGVILDTSVKKMGLAAAKFNGTDEYLYVPNSSDWDLGTSDFTIELWMYSKDVNQRCGYVSTNAVSEEGWSFDYGKNAGKIRFTKPGGSSIEADANFSNDTWYHIAVVRYSGRTDIYINGLSVVNNPSDTQDYTSDSHELFLGVQSFVGGNYMYGNLDEIRISDTARWTSDFSGSLPTVEYSDDVNTLFLWHCEGDISSNGSNVTLNDGVVINALTSKWHGSARTGATSGSYVSAHIGNLADWSNDFTIDFWIRFDNVAISSRIFKHDDSNDNFNMTFNTALNQLRVSTTIDGGSPNTTGGGAFDPVNDTWYHIAFTFESSVSNWKTYINGLLVKDTTITRFLSVTPNADFNIGGHTDLVNTHHGYYDEFRISDNLRWTEEFIPPTEPVSKFNKMVSGTTSINCDVIVYDSSTYELLGSDVDVDDDFEVRIHTDSKVNVVAIPSDNDVNAMIFKNIDCIYI